MADLPKNKGVSAAGEVAELKARLQEAEETLGAIRNGDVDAVVVGGPLGQQVYTLENADRPYRVLIEQMQEGAVTLGDDGTILYCNQRFAAIVRTPHEHVIGNSIVRFMSEHDRGAVHDLLLRGAGRGVSDEFTIQAADGTLVPVNISLVDLEVGDGMPGMMCGVVTDLTHNRRRNDELAAANASLAREIDERIRVEDSLSVALDAAGMGSWDLDLASKTMWRSLKHDQIFGYAVPQPYWTLDVAVERFLAEDRQAVAEAFNLAEMGGSFEFERRIARAGDGATRWVHMKGHTYYQGSLPVRIAGVISDVTDRRMIEEQLRQAQKMEAVGQLTGGIAHDFNNLLMIIGGSLDLLGRRVRSDNKASVLLEAARQGVARGAKLNQQLLAFSRRQDLRTDAICINDLLPEFELLLDRALGEMVVVEIDKAADLWYCSTDPHQLETAIVNLAINARDAMPEGGTLTLATQNRQVDNWVAARSGAAPGDYTVVSVADTGVGMSPDVASRIFEPFFTTKEIGKGTGLGLSQVYGFAKQSGGFVSIETEVGRGTKVMIHLPRTSPGAVGVAATPLVQPQINGDGVVLVVEDDFAVRATTRALLQDLGYRVLEAENAHSALDIVATEQPIELVFTDVIMAGGMNGIELANAITERRPELPVLLTSGYTAQRLVPDSVMRVWPLLHKPYTQSELSLAVENAINRVRFEA